MFSLENLFRTPTRFPSTVPGPGGINPTFSDYTMVSQTWSAGAMGYAATAAKKMALEGPRAPRRSCAVTIPVVAGKARVKMRVAQQLANEEGFTYSIPAGEHAQASPIPRSKGHL
jgi:hypothetical protein